MRAMSKVLILLLVAVNIFYLPYVYWKSAHPLEDDVIWERVFYHVLIFDFICLGLLAIIKLRSRRKARR